MRFIYQYCIVFFIFLGFCSASVVLAQENANCWMCHSYPGNAVIDEKAGEVRSFFIDKMIYSKSGHAKVDCNGCHGSISALPHKEVGKVECASSCHLGGDGSPDSSLTRRGGKVCPQQNGKDCLSCHPGEISGFSQEAGMADNGRTAFRYHAVGVPQDAEFGTASLCAGCHGGYPHTRAPGIRSMLNLHEPFMSCEACHMDKDKEPGGLVTHAWFDSVGNPNIPDLESENHHYGSRIAPIVNISGGTMRRLDHAGENAENFSGSALQSNLGPTERIRLKAFLHNSLTSPVSCIRCHSTDAYIDYGGLGYSSNRSEALTDGDVAVAAKFYVESYKPTLHDGDREKLEKMRKLGLISPSASKITQGLSVGGEQR